MKKLYMALAFILTALLLSGCGGAESGKHHKRDPRHPEPGGVSALSECVL